MGFCNRKSVLLGNLSQQLLIKTLKLPAYQANYKKKLNKV